MQVSTDPIERMVRYLTSSPSIPIWSNTNYLTQHKGRQPQFDYPAILNMLRDGKSVKTVALEMGCSGPSVYKILNTYNYENPSDAIELVQTKFGRPKQNNSCRLTPS